MSQASDHRFHAFVNRDKMPPTAEVCRALASRGLRVGFDTSVDLTNPGGPLQVTLDGETVAVSVEARPTAGMTADDEALRAVLKAFDLRLTFSSDEVAAGSWPREIARTLALLAMGAYENPQSDLVLHFGR